MRVCSCVCVSVCEYVRVCLCVCVSVCDFCESVLEYAHVYV